MPVEFDSSSDLSSDNNNNIDYKYNNVDTNIDNIAYFHHTVFHDSIAYDYNNKYLLYDLFRMLYRCGI
jgi:hypothetical protein